LFWIAKPVGKECLLRYQKRYNKKHIDLRLINPNIQGLNANGMAL